MNGTRDEVFPLRELWSRTVALKERLEQIINCSIDIAGSLPNLFLL